MSGYIGVQPVPQATQTRDKFVATSGQTSFPTSGYSPLYLDVYLNGVHLVDGTDYAATNGSDVVLSVGCTTGDVLEVVAYTTFALSNGSFSGTTTFDTVVVTNTVDGRDVSVDGTKLDTIPVISTSSTASFIAKGDGSSQDGYIQLNCSQNSHGIKLKSPPHSANASYTLTFPNDDGNANQVLTTNGSGVLSWATTSTTDSTKLPLAGGAMTGAITSVFAGGGDFVHKFQNTTAGTPYGVMIKDAVNGANGYPLFQVVDDDGSETYFRVQSGTGHVGIGVSPTNPLHVSSSLANGAVSYFHNTDTSNGQGILVRGGGSNSGKYIAQFQDAAANTRMQILANGDIKTQYGLTNGYSQSSGNGGVAFVNDTGSAGGSVISATNAARGWSNFYVNRFGWSSGQDGRLFQFTVNGSGVAGAIRVASASTVTFNTSSDYRLKENVVYEWDATTRLKQLKPARFNFIVDGAGVTQDGFMAHEAQEVVPIAVSGTKDAMMDEEYEVSAAVEEVTDDDGNITTEAAEAVMGTRSAISPQGIDHSKLVPLLVKTIIELEARITALEA